MSSPTLKPPLPLHGFLILPLVLLLVLVLSGFAFMILEVSFCKYILNNDIIFIISISFICAKQHTGDVNAPRSVVAHAKAVSGVCFDNFDSNRLATFSEDGIVKVWDLRKLVDPVSDITFLANK